MRLRIFDIVGPYSQMELTLYGPKDGNIIKTTSKTFLVTDEMVQAIETMAQNNPERLKEWLMKTVSETNPIKDIILNSSGNPIKLNNNGKPIDPVDDIDLDFKVKSDIL